MNARSPRYNEDEEIIRDLVEGMTYEDFASEYGMGVVDTDKKICEMRHRPGFTIERTEDEERGEWVWRIQEDEEDLKDLLS